MKILSLSALMLSSVALTACFNQPPAQVVIKGNNFYGTPEISLAQAAPKRVVATPSAKPEMTMPVLASRDEREYQPRPSYGYAPSQDTTATRVEMAQVSVKELEPLTASTAQPEPVAATTVQETTIAAAEPAPVVEKTPEVLPEPQARVVAETKTIAEKPASVASAPASEGFIWPVKGNVISEFGPKAGGEYNDGINIAAREGEPIVAAADGEVVYSGNELRGYGNMVILRHADGLMTAYAHADRVLVSKGENVQQGVTIATVGKSGGVEQAQVHFGVRKNKEPVDPMSVLGNSSFASR
jgi:murein DD-endopeptidase MepM/ murein hydrolase activator NlpD